MGRTVELVLIDGEGTLLGSLAPFVVSDPRWQHVADVIATARRLTGFQVNILRLLAAERDRPTEGALTYLAEVQSLALSHLHSLTIRSVPQFLVELVHRPEATRAPWATPGGPTLSVAWARSELRALGRGIVVKAEQQRAGNLAATWRLECSPRSGPSTWAWLEHVPSFLAHEAALLRWLGEHGIGTVVALLATDGHGRLLLEHVAGEDADASGSPQRDRFAATLDAIQVLALAHVDELVALGLPDRRGRRLVDYLCSALGHVAASAASSLLDDLPERLLAVESCGIADSLVHGDFHPGSVRVEGSRATLLDWTDAFVGHPAFDLLRLTEGCDAEQSRFLTHAWSQRWRARAHESTRARRRALAPGCRLAPRRALRRPVLPGRTERALVLRRRHLPQSGTSRRAWARKPARLRLATAHAEPNGALAR